MDVLVAVGVGVVSIAVTAFVTRLYGNRRKKVRVSMAAVPLISPGAVRGGVIVTVGGVVMDEPHSVQIAVTNLGPGDVLSQDFPDDLGRLRILGVTQMGPLRGDLWLKGQDQVLLEPQDPRRRDVGGGGGSDPTLWEFSATHIPKGATLAFSGVVNGRPREVTIDPLHNVDVVRPREIAPTLAAVLRYLGLAG